MANERTPRTLETRDQGQRRQGWKRQSKLPTPEPKDGLKFRWIRTSMLGQNDNTNVSSRFREGYTPVLAKDHPELMIKSDFDSRFKENVEVGGLMLCSIPVEYANERVDGQLEQANGQIEAVDRSFFRENDPRMPVLRPERSTRTSFGK